MKYPIFDSVISVIEAELSQRGIKPARFKVWQDTTLHATGLEIALLTPGHDSGVKEITINFDWDTFRETKLAALLEGMEQHPLLKRKKLLKSKALPTLDVETAWHFDESLILENGNAEKKGLHRLPDEDDEDSRVKYASRWMKALNGEISRRLPPENVISRWHLEISGDFAGKYVSTMSLLAYHQVSLSDNRHLKDVHELVRVNLQRVLSRILRILHMAGLTRPQAA